jgi:small redox-active disulfide protein 1
MTVVVELFYSPMCLYCPEARKVVMEVADEFGERVRVEEVNVLSPTGVERAERYGVRGVPTIIVDGRVKIEGVPTAEQLRRAIQQELDRREASSR